MKPSFFNWLKRKQHTGYLAIQAGAGGLSHVELNWQPGGRPSVASCVARSDDAESAKAWSMYSHAPVPVGVVLSAGEYQLLPIDAPPVPPDELKMAVRWRVKDQLDFPVDDATVDVIRLEQGNETGSKLLAVVAHNQVLKKYMSLAERARVELVAIDIPELAQRNISALLETPDRVLALLSFTPQGGLLTVTRNGELCFYRRLECNTLELAEQDADRRSVVFDRLALELQRSLDHIERQYSGWRLDRIVLAPPPAVPGMADYLGQQLYLPLETADLSARIAQLPAEPERLAACWFALGGALRREEKNL